MSAGQLRLQWQAPRTPGGGGALLGGILLPDADPFLASLTLFTLTRIKGRW